MATQSTATLEKLGDAKLTVADPKEDIRGRKVLDKNGDEVGKVDDLLIDDSEHKVRMLQVESGGFLGLGETKVLIPVDAITKIDEHIHINHTREHVARAPRYDPDLVQDRQYLGGVYGYYGYGPFWGSGYMYPGFPYYW
jgi:sporulation protein YlmC with PRC-barrel domain